MIANQVIGRGFRGVIQYLLRGNRDHPKQPEDAVLIGGNMFGRTPSEIAREFGETRRLRPTLSRAVYHVSLSLAPGEHMSEDEWNGLAEEYLQAMDFDNNQFVVIRHHDTPHHEHIHILACRIKMDGTVVSDSQNYARSAAFLKEFEKTHGLQPGAQTPGEAAQRGPKSRELRQILKWDEPSLKLQIQAKVDVARAGRPSFTDFIDRLEQQGVGVRVNMAKNGRIAGISYVLDGLAVKGSRLGKAYAWKGIGKDVDYQPERDMAAARAAAERAKHRSANGPGGQDAGNGSADREADEIAAMLTKSRASTGESERRRVADGNGRRFVGGDGPSPGRSAGTEIPSRARALSAATSHSENERSKDFDPASPDGDPFDDQSWLQRVVFMATSGDDTAPPDHPGTKSGDGDPPANAVAPSGSRPTGSHRRPVPPSGDRTAEAVAKHLRALGVARFDVGLRHGQRAGMIRREWNAAQVMHGLSWLKRMNAAGNHVYIRPAQAEGLVLLDDLQRQSVDRLFQDGLTPAAVVETSPGNYQAWIRLLDNPSHQPIGNTSLLSEASKLLARKYGADLAAVGWHRYGRLAGFTNQKPKYASVDGKQPYVLIHEASGVTAPQGLQILKQAHQNALKAHKLGNMGSSQQQAQIQSLKGSAGNPKKGLAGRYQGYYRRILRRNQGRPWTQPDQTDWSRMDYMISRDMAKDGYNGHAIGQTLLCGSPNLTSRKNWGPTHREHYALQTAQKALATLKAMAAKIQDNRIEDRDEEEEKSKKQPARGK